jgi:hypothetical protein
VYVFLYVTEWFYFYSWNWKWEVLYDAFSVDLIKKGENLDSAKFLSSCLRITETV